MITIVARARGPLMTGETDRICEAGFQAVLDEVGREGVNMLVGRMAQTYRRPTPYYWTQVSMHTPQPTIRQLDDARSGRPMVYGPWLEGTSSRNRTTRFKGYWIWRTIRQRLAQQAQRIADTTFRPYVARMNGGR